MTTESTQEAGADTTEAGGQQTTDDAKPAAAAPAAPASTEAPPTTPATPEAPAAEVVYEFTAPEGVTLDQARLDKFTAVAKELKLPADKAQALVDLAAEVEVERATQHAAQVAKWADEIKADKALGGDKLDETLATAKKVYNLLPAEEAASFKQMLDVSGFGNHPSMVRLLHAVGKALSEDKFVPGGKAPGAGKADANGFFDNSNMNP